jgi:sporulation protein YlmC with PRC-barrel domain
MNRTCTSLITASVLAFAATAAFGQSQPDSPRSAQSQSDSPRSVQSQSDSHRQSLQIAERLMQERSGLYGAIAIAETHTKGIAIGVRLSTNQDIITHQDRQTGQQQTRPAVERSTQSAPLFAIVTCVIDKTRVRDVMIDMRTNTVVGVQTAVFSDSAHHEREYDRDYDSSSDAASGFARASDLMNATVQNRADKKLGDIDELAIDPDANRVVYGVLRRGGIMGIGESRYAIASSQLTPLRNGRIVLDLEESHFKNITGFDNKNWPTQAEPRLSPGRSAQAADAPTARRVVKASDIIGENVQCRDGHTVGKISDLVVESRSGRVLYAIVNADRGHMPVPMATLRKTDKHYILPMPMDQLRSMPMLDADRDPNWSDENWNRRIHESYGTKFETASARDSR